MYLKKIYAPKLAECRVLNAFMRARTQERGILLHGHEPLDTDMTPSLVGEARSQIPDPRS